MKIELYEIPVRDLVEGFEDNGVEGVVGYGGRLDIRPKYQREFIYNEKQQAAVIKSIRNGFPLNSIYWMKRDDGTFEVLDGQQRILSICNYVSDNFAIDYRFWHNLNSEERDQILNYKLMVYFCEGTDKERLDWFRTINIAGLKLTDQELRNAVYAGSWLSDAKLYFSKPNCPVEREAKQYLRGSGIRQDYLETALDWISEGHIEDYMAKHQNDPDAIELWLYFKKVIDWVRVIFPVYRKEMKGVPFGRLYNQFKDTPLHSAELEERIKKLMEDDEVTKKSGIYTYVLTGDERALQLRRFTQNQRREAYERQDGICPLCGDKFELSEMEADHIIPWSQGGKTTSDNCQMLCRKCNRAKGSK
jgi:hypothetical protein